MSATHEEMAVLLAAFDASDWQEMTVQLGADRIHVSRREVSSYDLTGTIARVPVRPATVAPDREDTALATAGPGPAADTRAGVEEAEAQLADPTSKTTQVGRPGGVTVSSPSLGIYWRAPSPTEPPFVEVGDRVDAQDTVGIVEVMKLMQQVTAGTSGTVTAIMVNNGETVEYGQALVCISPSGG